MIPWYVPFVVVLPVGSCSLFEVSYDCYICGRFVLCVLCECMAVVNVFVSFHVSCSVCNMFLDLGVFVCTLLSFCDVLGVMLIIMVSAPFVLSVMLFCYVGRCPSCLVFSLYVVSLFACLFISLSFKWRWFVERVVSVYLSFILILLCLMVGMRLLCYIIL